ncbi:Tetratricopeptide repeat and ankyrin repeat containing 1 [Seminavis robusta]|uniref:Tetratricopeptide repeat and ankyrin repeat containing 1 n=1 Tax=Seminavis robusta TaxID=568900 RepID=A0A9N8HIR9_9STRA|nr:Tetratricopeptide repeat and ankyrin repeat containing 1 [Seminavis robusta]|eukprot:Sro717_g192000.1 Tetratricopeptide repeat and ankyrin repeat containing 1 (2712) ;mRNA; r:14034-22914
MARRRNRNNRRRPPAANNNNDNNGGIPSPGTESTPPSVFSPPPAAAANINDNNGDDCTLPSSDYTPTTPNYSSDDCTLPSDYTPRAPNYSTCSDDDSLPPPLALSNQNLVGSSSRSANQDCNDGMPNLLARGSGDEARVRNERAVASSSGSDDCDDEDFVDNTSEEEEDDGSTDSPPPLVLSSRRSNSPSSISSSSNDEDDEKICPVIALGDYVVYHLGGNNTQWLQGRVVKVKIRNIKKRNKTQEKKTCRVYHIQPLDGRPKHPIEIQDSDKHNEIALDPMEGAVLNFRQGDKVLVLLAKSKVPARIAKYLALKPRMNEQWQHATVEKVWPFIQGKSPQTYSVILDKVPPEEKGKCPMSFEMEDTVTLDKVPPEEKEKCPIFLEKEDPLALRMRHGATSQGDLFQPGQAVECLVEGAETSEEGAFPFHLFSTDHRLPTDNYAAYFVMIMSSGGTLERTAGKCRSVIVDEHVPCLIRPRSQRIFSNEVEPCSDVRTLLHQGMEHNTRLSFFRGLDKSKQAGQLVLNSCPDYWVAQAIKAGAYDALLWLEQDLGVNLDSFVLPQTSKNGHQQHSTSSFRGRGLLHCLVDSPKARQFFSAWAARSHGYYQERTKGDKGKTQDLLLKCLTYDSDASASRQMPPMSLAIRDQDGQTFFHAIVKTKDISILQSVVARSASGNCQRLWDLVHVFNENEPLVMVKDDQGMTPADLARSLQEFRMARILDRFAASCCVHFYSRNLRSGAIVGVIRPPTLYGLVRDDTMKETIENQIARELRFMHREYGGEHFVSCGEAFAMAAQAGDLERLRYLVERNRSSLRSTKRKVVTTADKGEFTWRHFRLLGKTPSGKPTATEDLDLVACAVHGPSALARHWPLLEQDDVSVAEVAMKERYWNFIFGNEGATPEWTGKHVSSEPSGDLEAFLKGTGSSCRVSNLMKRHKSTIVHDDDNLGKRLDVLRYLIRDLRLPPPSVVDCLRWRQCGVVRSLMEQSLLRLHDTVETNKELSAFLLQGGTSWLSSGKTSLEAGLKSLTVGQTICFLAVEFDDLQTFDFVLSSGNVSPSICFQGWTLLHVSAFYSRREISAYLVRVCPSLVKEKLAYSRFEEGKYASHIAIEQGDLLLAQFLVQSGCPSLDSKQKPLYWYGEQNPINSEIREWSDQNREREKFEGTISALNALLFSNKIHEPNAWNEIKSFITSHNCFADDAWKTAGYEDPDKPCKGTSFWDIVDRIAETANASFMLWFYEQTLPDSYFDVASHHPFCQKMRSFWKRAVPGANDLDGIMKAKGKKGLKEYLEQTKKIVGPKAFSPLESLAEKMASTRRTGEARIAAAPLDPVFVRLWNKIQYRRKTKLVEAYQLKKQELLFQEFVTDLLISSKSLLEKHISDGSSKDVLDESLHNLISCADLLKKISPSHPLLDVGNSNFWGSSAFLPNGRINSQFEAPGAAGSVAQRLGNALGVAISNGHVHVLEWLPDLSEHQRRRMLRLAGMHGQSGIIDHLLQLSGGWDNGETQGGRYLSAALGAAEAGQSSVEHYFREARKRVHDPTELSQIFSSAVLGLYSHVNGDGSEDGEDYTRHSACINWLGSQPEVQKFDGVVMAKKMSTKNRTALNLFVEIFKLLDADEIWKNQFEILNMCRDLLCRYQNSPVDAEALADLVVFLANSGVDIQSVLVDILADGGIDNSPVSSEIPRLRGAQQKQLLHWLPFRMLVLGFKQVDVVDGYNNSGMRISHCAAMCDRADVLDCIQRLNPDVVGKMDKQGRTIDTFARDSNASSVLLWIERRAAGVLVGTTLASHYRRRMAVRQKDSALEQLRKIQWVWKGALTRKMYRALIEMRLDQRKRYTILWGRLDEELQPKALFSKWSSWDSLKNARFNLAANLDQLREYGDTFKQLDDAANEVFYDSDEEVQASLSTERAEEEKKDDAVGLCSQETVQDSRLEPQDGVLRSLPLMDNIKLTKQVLAWIRKNEGKYVDLFLRRIEQLASGQRSRILQKGLVGSNTAIYETYLEQKSAQRIMWTPCVEDGKNCILVWYVARHKEVSRLMELIDQSQKRTARDFVSATTLYADNGDLVDGTIVIDPNDVLLDPIADVPLKLHQIRRNEIGKLASSSWVPPLRLTPEERLCVEKEGTVLLLGRSGTGKTLCIANRILRDANENKTGFKALFVARSKKICRHVRALVGDNWETADEDADASKMKPEYVSFAELLDRLGETLGELRMFRTRRSYVDFQRFRRELLYRGSLETTDSLDPLVIWAQIRTFIKGSIEAVQRRRPLSLDEYLALGKKQCRLSLEQRNLAYSAFVYYNDQMQKRGFWDDCDKCSWFLQALQRLDSTQLHELQFCRVYVDEVQDYTQAQLALFYTLCREKSLFLAGDNAQSVEEGVDFRFEDLRAVAYVLYEGDTHYIPQKPLKVNKNFRSHAGILDLAASILERLFAAFPASTRKLPPDRGVFVGPRPGILSLDQKGLDLLLQRNPRLFVLMHDEKVASMRDALQAKNNVFRDVVIVNFFCDLEEAHQKAWQELLRDRDYAVKFEIAPGYPQLEGHLKLLYTAITRTSRRLFFVEKRQSIAGRAFFRWLAATKKLAEKLDASKMETVMTPDEWRCLGVDLAVNAEDTDESYKALEWLDRAIHCFEQVGEEALLKKARAHEKSLKLRLEADQDKGLEVTEDKEQEICDAAYACAREGVIPELFRLVSTFLPKLNSITQDGLESDLLEKIKDFV